MQINGGFHYYVDGDGVWTKDIHKKSVNDFLQNGSEIHSQNYLSFFPTDAAGPHSFKLETSYPGMIIGSGYSHPALTSGADNDQPKDFNFGFFFDHTTGLPIIPGSTVKGILKSVFPKPEGSFIDEKMEYLKSLLPEELKAHKEYVVSNWKDIFFERKQVFFDAIPLFDSRMGNIKLFEEDYITPHSSAFSEPTPIRFIKLAPGIPFQFRFLLKPFSTKEPELKIEPEHILSVFNKTLLEFGIGAKRNSGFGNLVKHGN